MLAILIIMLSTVGCGRIEADLSQKIDNNSNPDSVLNFESTRMSSLDGMEMIHFPVENFIMGLNRGLVNEKPEHEVYLDAFWIDLTEVTNVMYRLCVEV